MTQLVDIVKQPTSGSVVMTWAALLHMIDRGLTRALMHDGYSFDPLIPAYEFFPPAKAISFTGGYHYAHDPSKQYTLSIPQALVLLQHLYHVVLVQGSIGNTHTALHQMGVPSDIGVQLTNSLCSSNVLGSRYEEDIDMNLVRSFVIDVHYFIGDYEVPANATN